MATFLGGPTHLNRRQLLTRSTAGAVSLALPAILPSRPARAADGPYAALRGLELELLIWDGGAFVDSMMATVQKSWSAIGGGTLHARKVPFADLDRAVRAANQGERGPDIFLANAPNVWTYVSLGLVAPVTDMFSQADLDDFFPVVRQGSTVKGEFYGPSTNENGQAMYYDRALLARYGIAPPATLDTAWTWQQALDVFKTVQAGERKRRGTDAFWAVYPSMGNTGFFFSGVYPRGAADVGSKAWKLVSEDGLSVDGYLNAPQALEGLQFMQDLHHRHGVAPVTRQADMFYNDQVAFFIGVPLYYSTILKRRPGIDLATTPVPIQRNPIIHTGSFAWLVNAETQRMQEAKLFVKFMGSREGNDGIARGWTSPPIRRSMIADRPELQRAPLSLFVDALDKWSVPRPITPGFSEYDSMWTKLEADIVAGGHVTRLTQDAVGRIDAQLRRYG